MEIYGKRIKLIVLIFIGMISFLLVYDKIYYNNRHKFYINKSVDNSVQFLKSNNLDENSIFVSPKVKSETKHSLNELFSTNKFVDNLKDKNIESQHQLLVSKIIGFESQFLIPFEKWSHISKLLYPDHIKPITVMTIGDKICDNNYGNSLKVVIVVISRVNGFRRREILRQTWAKRIPDSKSLKLYFAIGLDKNSEIQSRLVIENEKFNDLLQWNFIDSYYNLTIKSLAILRWFSFNCFKSQFLYKIDDDCIVNYDNLIKFTSSAMQNSIYGHLWKKAFVDRTPNSKFYLSKSDYSNNSYPDYTGGPWLMSGAIVPLLYETAITKSLPALPYEDVYITGVVANKAHIKRKQLTGLVYFDKSMIKKVNYCWFEKTIIFWQNLDDFTIQKLWTNIENSKQTKCVSIKKIAFN